MPSRLVCVAVLVFWLYAAVGLVTRDLLPELSVGSPPDMRTIASAGEESGPARWIIEMVDPSGGPDSRRTIGQATTESKRSADGVISMTSHVVFDSGRLLGSLVRTRSGVASEVDDQILFDSTYLIDPSGNLRSFVADVRLESQPSDLWKIEGNLKNGMMDVVSRGPLPFLNRKVSFEYHPRGVVQSQFGPLDRLPGLQVGQHWDERAASPFTGQVETVRASVEQKTVIHWDTNPVATLEVVHRSKTVTARTWVRPDGLVLRQEVALPLLRLVLERLPEGKAGALFSPKSANASGSVPSGAGQPKPSTR
jgi:hypothetical protein